ncbi:hypothetical protein [Halorubellus salinus]|uniref:hypothetical protein n=1 Tax=Halorubellus salinus TaxID=755309 RepID=UPI001D090263|nr:hypothetical protein [Halorubellus salinus]
MGSVEIGDAAMTNNASAGEKPPAPTDAQPTNHTTVADAIEVHQLHEVTPSGIETTTRLLIADGVDAVVEPVAHQLLHAYDIDVEDHGVDVVALEPDGGHHTRWTYGHQVATRAQGGGDGA